MTVLGSSEYRCLVSFSVLKLKIQDSMNMIWKWKHMGHSLVEIKTLQQSQLPHELSIGFVTKSQRAGLEQYTQASLSGSRDVRKPVVKLNIHYNSTHNQLSV